MKRITALWLGSIFLCPLFAQATSDQVFLSYSGTVVTPPCLISTPSLTVDFGDIPAGDLATADSTTDWKNTLVELSQCTNVTSVTMTVNAAPSDANPKYIRSTGTAEHVAVEAREGLVSFNDLFNGATIGFDTLGNPTNKIDLRFRIRNDGTGAATGGTVISTMTLTYIFK